MELTEQTILYRNCNGIKVNNHRVRHVKLHSLSRSITKLRRALGESEHELFWHRPLRILRYYQFNSIWAPVPLNDPLLIAHDQMGVLHEALDKVVQTYPSQVKNFKECCDLLQELYYRGTNPLYDCMIELLSSDTFPIGSLLVLLHKPRAQETVSEAIKFSISRGEIPNIEFDIVTAPALKSVQAAKTMLLFGPVSLYEKRRYVFSSPKVGYFHTINYAWFNDRIMIENDFNGSLGSLPQIKDDGHIMYGEDTETLVTEEVPSDPVLEVSTEQVEVSSTEAVVTARFFLLEGDNAVWLDDSENKKSYVINPIQRRPDRHYDVSEYIEKRDNDKIEEGDYLILRHRGSGDYIPDYADSILGESARQMRAYQELWKGRLRDIVEKLSKREVSIQLLDLGSKLANENNLRNWMSSDGIKTFYREDFKAIMKLVGLEGQEEELWNNAVKIHNAHIQAGQQIRHELFKVMSSVNVLELQISGIAEIHLDDENVGSLVIIRVVEPTENRQKMARNMLPYFSSIEV